MGVAELFELIKDELLSALEKEGRALGANPVRLVAFVRAHDCRRLAMRGLEIARCRRDASLSRRAGDGGGTAAPLAGGDGRDAVDADVAEEIEDFVNLLV